MKKQELNISKLQLQKEKITDLIASKRPHNSGAEASHPAPITTQSLILERCG
jgi:hypothetical protein